MLAGRWDVVEVMLALTQSSVIAGISSKNDLHWQIRRPGPWPSVDKSTTGPPNSTLLSRSKQVWLDCCL